jgi:membrane AbrB-like protein
VIDRIRTAARELRERWRSLAIALALGLAGGVVFVELRIPLPWVIGPIFANLVAALAGLKLWVPHWLRLPMFAIIGALFGMTVTPAFFAQIPKWWPTMLAIGVFVALAVVSVTWYLRRIARYDIVTSFFSSTPGGMVAAIAMGSEYGADVRTISLTQSMRLIVTVFTIPLAFRLFGDYQATGAIAFNLVEVPMGGTDLALALAGVVGGYWAGKLLRMPSPHLLGPMAGIAALNLAGAISLQFPDPVVAGAQLVIGCAIGAAFTGVRLRAVGFAMGHGLASGFVMLFVGLGCAVVAHWITGAPQVELILAFAPGGFAEMALVAFGLGADLTFVIFHQLVRYILVMILSPVMVAMLRRRGVIKTRAERLGHS